MPNHEPTTETTRRLQEHLSPLRWQARIERAEERARAVEELRRRVGEGKLGMPAVREVDPELTWTTARRWWEWDTEREGEPWERMMDRRMPPKPWKTPKTWEAAIRALGRQEPQPELSEIRDLLAAEYGPRARLCDNTLRRILREAGLWTPSSRRGREKLTELNGGGALVLLLAACIETGAAEKMAEGISTLAKVQPSPEGPLPAAPAGRDERGRFTAEYNANRQEMLDELGCTVYRSVEEVRKDKDLSRLRLASLSPRTLGKHLRCAMALPLLTLRRGTVGLDGPAGAWLEILSPVAYKAATVDKTLGELKLLGASETMWESHARNWLGLSGKWAGEGWRQLVDYVDATYDPWWTERYAQSGKVSRTGRVQPCLARPMLSSGPGVPIIAHVVSGTTSLGDHLLPMLELADDLRGEDTLGRITVVDSECCTIDLLRHFEGDPRRDVITVIKGTRARGKVLEQAGEWEPFRSRDLLREGVVELERPNPKKQKAGLKIRVVEMVRDGSRHPKPTWFATTAGKEKLSTLDVAEAYLSRWPFQEDLFRRGRNGAGLERSHGYGVSKVTHMAIIDKREKAGRKLCNTTLELRKAEEAEARAAQQLEEAKQRLSQRRAEAKEKLDGRNKLGVRQGRARLKDCQKETKRTRRAQDKAAKEYEELQSMPDEIYARDTELDSAATCLKMMLLAMLEFFCQEYLGRLRIMPRTVIEEWLMLPVTIRQTRWKVVYEVAPNPRNPAMTRLLAQALDRITERKLRVDDRLMVARIRDGP